MTENFYDGSDKEKEECADNPSKEVKETEEEKGFKSALIDFISAVGKDLVAAKTSEEKVRMIDEAVEALRQKILHLSQELNDLKARVENLGLKAIEWLFDQKTYVFDLIFLQEAEELEKETRELGIESLMKNTKSHYDLENLIKVTLARVERTQNTKIESIIS